MHSSSARPTPETPDYRRTGLAIFGLCYLVFVVYGSLVPLALRPMPLAAALEAFSHIRYLDLGIASRADWVANILLFIPLTYVWMGALIPARPGVMRALTAVAVFSAALGLSVGIEFTQLFFPPRTVSLNDILAEGLGAAMGIVLWSFAGQRMMRWLESLPRAQGAQATAERLLAVYLLLLFGYNVLPLDLTLSPVEVYHKWREGRVLLIPFSAPYGSGVQLAYGLISDVAIWIPAAVLWTCSRSTPAVRVWFYVVGAAALLEFMQLFVYSRVSDVTDVLTAASGGAIGVWIVRAWRKAAVPAAGATVDHGQGRRGGVAGWLALAAWFAVVLLVFWYPFDFNFDPMFVHDRMLGARRVPFEALYFGTEFRAVTEVLHKVGFMVPLGVLLGWIAARGLGKWSRGMAISLAAVIVAVVAGGIEIGQLFLPGKIADLTDALFEGVGGLLGLALGLRLVTAGTEVPGSDATDTQVRRSVAKATSGPALVIPASEPRSVWVADLAAVALLAVMLFVAARLPGMPYNVRELLEPSAGGAFAAVGLASVFWWLLAMPLLLMDRWRSRPEHALWLVPGLPLLAFPPALMLWITVPQESLDDIVGSPVLGWGAPLEFVLRYMALFAAVALAAMGAVWLVARLCSRRRIELLPRWIIVVALWGWPLHAVVVIFAATDNLTELMRGGGGMLASLALFWGAFALLTSASAVAAALARAGRGRRLVSTAVATWLLSVACLWFGSEPEIFKYGRVFSAAQFLLSGDRDHYANAAVLWLRFGLLGFGLSAVAALLQVPRWRRFATRAARRSPSAIR